MEEEQKKPEIDNVLLQKLHDKLDKAVLAMERSSIADYVTMIKRPWRYLLLTFASGIARGVGIAIGLTVITAVVLFVLTRILSHLVTLPFVGQMLAQLVEYVNQYLKEGTKINIQ